MQNFDFDEWARLATAARDKQMKALRTHGQIGEEARFACQLSPLDNVMTMRQGPKATPSSLASLYITQRGERAMVALSPANARRLAAALLNIADEIDPYDPKKETLS